MRQYFSVEACWRGDTWNWNLEQQLEGLVGSRDASGLGGDRDLAWSCKTRAAAIKKATQVAAWLKKHKCVANVWIQFWNGDDWEDVGDVWLGYKG